MRAAQRMVEPEPCEGIQIGGCGFWYGRGQGLTYLN
jgi:hypothetical protein